MYIGFEYHVWAAWDTGSLILRGLVLFILWLAISVRRGQEVVW